MLVTFEPGFGDLPNRAIGQFDKAVAFFERLADLAQFYFLLAILNDNVQIEPVDPTGDVQADGGRVFVDFAERFLIA